MTKKYRSDAFAAIHEAMEALHEVGTIDKQTMRQFDEACLTLRKPRNNRGDRSLLTHPSTGCNYSVPLFDKEGLGEILLDKSPSIPLFQRGR
jgi:hypothetical protein